MATARPNRVSTARKTSPMPPSPSLLSIRYGPRMSPAVNSVTVESSSSCGAFWMAGRSRNSAPIPFASSDSTSRRNSGSVCANSAARSLGGCFASRVVELFNLPETLRSHGTGSDGPLTVWLNSRNSHALARSQSRLTVRGEIFSAATISSSVNPPK